MFRFTIRDALWLTVVVGMGMAWWVDRSQLIDKLKVAQHDIKEAYFWMGLWTSPFE